jgi:Icc-related predicted phosphoesterase
MITKTLNPTISPIIAFPILVLCISSLLLRPVVVVGRCVGSAVEEEEEVAGEVEEVEEVEVEEVEEAEEAVEVVPVDAEDDEVAEDEVELVAVVLVIPSPVVELAKVGFPAVVAVGPESELEIGHAAPDCR